MSCAAVVVEKSKRYVQGVETRQLGSTVSTTGCNGSMGRATGRSVQQRGGGTGSGCAVVGWRWSRELVLSFFSL